MPDLKLPPRVVLYHCVGTPIERVPAGTAGSQEMGMITPPEVLEAHISWLGSLGYRFVTAGELSAAWRGGTPPSGLAALTFDDGWLDGLTTVAPCLTRLGVRATFFVCPEGFGNRVSGLGEAGVILTEADARALHAAGMELGSHTLSHPNVLELTDAALRRELAGSRDAVEAITGESCLTLSYPTGRHDPRVERAAAEAGYRIAFTCRGGPWLRLAAPRWQAPVLATPSVVARRLGLSAALPAPPAGSQQAPPGVGAG
jgi:peptidoglycan/xylan/chitin deacetylase (PgdA/CDA1 family)